MDAATGVLEVMLVRGTVELAAPAPAPRLLPPLFPPFAFPPAGGVEVAAEVVVAAEVEVEVVAAELELEGVATAPPAAPPIPPFFPPVAGVEVVTAILELAPTLLLAPVLLVLVEPPAPPTVNCNLRCC